MRSRSPSLPSTRPTWVLTVASDRYSRRAISALDSPRPSRVSTSCSRVVSGESGGLPGRVGWCGLEEPLDQAAGGAGRDDRVPGEYRPDRGHELRRQRVLEQEPAGSGPQPGVYVLVEVEGGQQDHPGRRFGGADPRGGFDPVQVRHPDVHQHQVGLELRGLADGRQPVGGLADHLEVLDALQDGAQAGADEFLVVGDEQPHGRTSNGSRAYTWKPPCGLGPVRSSPPNMVTRSRMPRSPRPGVPEPLDGPVVPPVSVTLICTSEGAQRTETSARAPGPACLSVFVSPSCTMRYAESPTSAGTGPAGSIASVTGSPAARTRSARSGRSASPGSGARRSRESRSPASSRSNSRRISPSAPRPWSTIASRAARATAGSRSIACAAACAWITITDRPCATTSCISRATRARSAATSDSASRSWCCRRSRARACASSAYSRRARTISPTSQAAASSSTGHCRSSGEDTW